MDIQSRRLILIRHGETAWAKEGRHTGRIDVSLDETGEMQARALHERLQKFAIAHVFVSPLQRARQTCDLAGYGSEAIVDSDLMEWNYGDYEGETSAEIHAERPGWVLWRDGVVKGESVDDVGARADRVLHRLQSYDGDVAIFAHGHFLQVLAARWLGLPPRGGAYFALPPAGISVLGFDRTAPVILQWNID